MQAQVNGPDPDLEKKQGIVQANKDELNWRTKYRVCKFVLYIFYGYSISSSFRQYFIGSLNRITISPDHLLDYVNIIYGLVNFIACFLLIHCLHTNSKKKWKVLCTFHFIGIFSYKIAFCFNYFVKSDSKAMPYLDLSYCDRHYMMPDLQITRMVLESALDIVALICFTIINAKLSKHWTQQECLKKTGAVNLSENNQETIKNIIPGNIFTTFSAQDQSNADKISDFTYDSECDNARDDFIENNHADNNYVDNNYVDNNYVDNTYYQAPHVDNTYYQAPHVDNSGFQASKEYSHTNEPCQVLPTKCINTGRFKSEKVQDYQRGKKSELSKSRTMGDMKDLDLDNEQNGVKRFSSIDFRRSKTMDNVRSHEVKQDVTITPKNGDSFKEKTKKIKRQGSC